jgi:hypothetical protein
MEPEIRVVMQTNPDWSWDDSISGVNQQTGGEEWIAPTPDDPAVCISHGRTDGYEIIAYNSQTYLVQSIDLDWVEPKIKQKGEQE